MRRVMLWTLSGVIACGVALTVQTRTASAIAQFKKEFDNKYTKDPKTAEEKALAAAAAGAKCNVCHAGTSKKMRNAYGEALDQLLDKKADKDNPAKIIEALDKVAAMPSSAEAGAKTFGELIAEGKLPGRDGK